MKLGRPSKLDIARRNFKKRETIRAKIGQILAIALISTFIIQVGLNILGTRTISIANPVLAEARTTETTTESGVKTLASEIPSHSPDSIEQLIIQTFGQDADDMLAIAKEENIDWKLLYAVCQVESQCNSDRIGDGGKSYGAFQIYLPAHPDITIAQATNFKWAARWTAQHGKKYANNPAMFFKNHNGIAKTTNDWYVKNALDKYNEIATISI